MVGSNRLVEHLALSDRAEHLAETGDVIDDAVRLPRREGVVCTGDACWIVQHDEAVLLHRLDECRGGLVVPVATNEERFVAPALCLFQDDGQRGETVLFLEGEVRGGENVLLELADE